MAICIQPFQDWNLPSFPIPDWEYNMDSNPACRVEALAKTGLESDILKPV